MRRSHQILERVTSAYNAIDVQRVGRRIDLEVAGATFATWHPDFLLTGYSWDAVTAGALLSETGPPQRLLLLGLAGGTVTRQLRRLLPAALLTGIEIDDAVLRLARAYLHLDDQDLELIVDDAYHWTGRSRRHFDVIIDDIFLTGPDDVKRPLLPSVPALRPLARRLAPGGVLVGNYIITGPHRDTYHQAMQSFLGVFAEVAEVAPPRGYNRILVGGNALADASRLRAYGAAFARARDRALWDRIEVRRFS